jgi:hypothetical protein
MQTSSQITVSVNIVGLIVWLIIGQCVFGRSAIAVSLDEERSFIGNMKERVNSPIPEGEYLLYREIEKNDQDITTLTQFMASAKSFKDYPTKVDSEMLETKTRINSIKTLTCPAQDSKIRDEFNKLYQRLAEAYQIIQKNDWEDEFAQYSDTLSVITQKN